MERVIDLGCRTLQGVTTVIAVTCALVLFAPFLLFERRSRRDTSSDLGRG